MSAEFSNHQNLLQTQADAVFKAQTGSAVATGGVTVQLPLSLGGVSVGGSSPMNPGPPPTF